MIYVIWLEQDIDPFLTRYKKYPVIENGKNTFTIKMNDGTINVFSKKDLRFDFDTKTLTGLDKEIYELKMMGYRYG